VGEKVCILRRRGGCWGGGANSAWYTAGYFVAFEQHQYRRCQSSKRTSQTHPENLMRVGAFRKAVKPPLISSFRAKSRQCQGTSRGQGEAGTCSSFHKLWWVIDVSTHLKG
jgi:hypothetical protein